METFIFNLGPLGISGQGDVGATLAAALGLILVVAIVRGGHILPSLMRDKPLEKPPEESDE